jgi:preprotein translocase subunit SecG
MLFTVLITLYVIICVSLIVVILLQSGKGSGLSGIFGSGGGGQTIFGARAGDVMTKTTTVLAICFMGFSLVLALLSARESSSLVGEIEAVGLEMPRPEAPPEETAEETAPLTVPPEEASAPVPQAEE